MVMFSSSWYISLRMSLSFLDNLALVIDEADALGYSEPNEESNLNAAEELAYLCESASNSYEISGTMMEE